MVEICVVRKERLSIDLRKFSCVGTSIEIGGNAAAWDGPNQRLSSATKRLQMRFKTDLGLAERMRRLRDALP